MSLHRLLALLPFMLLAACGQGAPERLQLKAFDRPVELLLWGPADGLLRQAADDLRFIETVTHPWAPGSLGRTNQLLATTATFSANPSLLPLIRQCQQLYRRSGGLFNPAAGGLYRLWGFHAGKPATPPRAPFEALLAQAPVMEDIKIDGIRMHGRNPALRLDFGDYAYGYALDTAAWHLRAAGIGRAEIRSDGDRLLIGGKPQVIELPLPLEEQTGVKLRLKPGEALYTLHLDTASGPSGRRYGTLLDPRSGLPVKAYRAISVIHPSMAEAAAIATALAVAGTAQWKEVLAQMGADKALLLHKDSHLDMSEAFAARLDKDTPPAAK